jgi:hypothetical protein
MVARLLHWAGGLRLGSDGSALAANALANRPRGPAVPTSPADQVRLMLVTPGIEGLDGQNVAFSYIYELVLKIVFAAWVPLSTKSRFS